MVRYFLLDNAELCLCIRQGGLGDVSALSVRSDTVKSPESADLAKGRQL